MLDEFIQHLSHETVVPSNELLLLVHPLLAAVGLVVYLLLRHILKHALHVLVVLRNGKA